MLSEGIKPRITIGITPILCEQLSSDAFKEEFPRFLESRLGAALKDKQDFIVSGSEGHLAPIAEMWAAYYSKTLEQFRELDYDIVGTFSRLQEQGIVEILTSGGN